MKFAWIGTGVMGASMCGRLMDAGHSAVVNNRTRSKADGLVERGATWADTPRTAAESVDVVFSMVGHPSDVREVILGADGALAGCREGTLLVDMPRASRRWRWKSPARRKSWASWRSTRRSPAATWVRGAARCRS